MVEDLASSQASAAEIGWLRYFWDHVLQKDIFAVINKSDKLIQIHATAEQFDPTTENLFRQITVCILNSFTGSVCMHACMNRWLSIKVAYSGLTGLPRVSSVYTKSRQAGLVIKHMRVMIAERTCTHFLSITRTNRRSAVVTSAPA